MSAGLGIDYLIWPPVIAYFIAAYIIYPFISLLCFGSFQWMPDDAGMREWSTVIGITTVLAILFWSLLGVGSRNSERQK